MCGYTGRFKDYISLIILVLDLILTVFKLYLELAPPVSGTCKIKTPALNLGNKNYVLLVAENLFCKIYMKR